jgi:integrase
MFLTEQDRADQLRRCLHDEDMPVEDRVAGAVVLLFGIPLTRLAQLTVDDVDCGTKGTRLRIGTHWLQLPPHLADLLTRLVEQPPPNRSTLAKLAPTRWLFPGATPTRPASQSQLQGRLRRHGITAAAGRNTARAALASRLPASILADLTGIHIHTAVAWNRLTGRDWTEYVALRAEDGPARTRTSVQTGHGEHAVPPQ